MTPEPVDARLLLPAAATWLGAFVVRGVLSASPTAVQRHEAATRCAVVILVGLAVVLVAALLIRLLVHRSRAGPWLTAPAALLACVFVLLGSLAAAVHVRTLAPPPLGGWIDARATAVVEGVITTEARARSLRSTNVWQSAHVVEARLATALVEARGDRRAVGLSIIIRLDAGADVPAPGSWVRIVGGLGPAPWQSDASATLAVSELTSTGSPGAMDTTASAMRSGLRTALGDVAPEPGSLVAGLAVGDDSAAPPELADDMRRSGLSHLTAVSGGNVAVILAVVLGVLALMRAPLWARTASGLVALCYFVVLVGPQPSVIRAATMGALAVAGTLVGGRRAGPSILGSGVLVLLILMPWLATSWAFALSAFATGGLILLAGPLTDRIARWRPTAGLPQAIRDAVGLTVAAQLATLPVLVAMGGAVGWVALPANVLVMPVVAPVTVLGLASAGVAPISTGAASAVAGLAAWPAGWIATVAHATAALPPLQPPWPQGWWGVAAVAVTVVLVQFGLRVWRRLSSGLRGLVALVLVSVIVIGVAAPPSRRGWPPDGWLLIMCDVGQGDAMLLRAGPTAAVVVDTGPDPALIDGCLSDAGIDAVPAVVLTHFHADHVGGLSGVLRHRSVASVLATPIREPHDQADAVDRIAAGAGLDVESITAGDRRTVATIEWRAVWPRRVITSGSVPNNASLVLMVAIAGRHVLLTGDIEPEAQTAIAADVASVRWDVVKVPHHGSRFQAAGLTSWAPASIALISVGADNDYGHPAGETIASWAGIGAVVARTDRDGDVAVVPYGDGVGVVARDGPRSAGLQGGMLPPS